VSHIKADKLKGLVVTSGSRLASLPQVPTSKEADLKEFTIDSWFALYAPAGTSNDIVNQINAEIVKILAMPDIKKKAEDAGTLVDYMNPAQLGEYTKKELDYWGRVIRSSKITAE
jgi:tripartite-type tricarboxylate transporter receptor subunit TctC